ncbi:MAG TPA: glutamyl-tRNA amidotransferase [Gammaproteobacteria bacterium]|nr:glutamyl-tRNA amidotransferase [Gammaproteobacteria bacterium]HAT26912.1 glutamyl-tRNA amidotransferase [Gammaproteobacteria bacterium]
MSDSALKQEITEAMKTAMRARDKARLGTIRLALSEIKRVEVDERIDPDDTRVIAILDKMLKQRRESIRMFEEAERTELADQEKFEIAVLQEFLPQALSTAELDDIIQSALSESGAESMKDMGKVMGLVKPQVIGRADMGSISQKIKAALS